MDWSSSGELSLGSTLDMLLEKSYEACRGAIQDEKANWKKQTRDLEIDCGFRRDQTLTGNCPLRLWRSLWRLIFRPMQLRKRLSSSAGLYSLALRAY